MMETRGQTGLRNMTNGRFVFVGGLFFGAILGYLASGTTPFGSFSPKPGALNADAGAGAQSHDHSKTIDLPEAGAPQISLDVKSEGGCAYDIALTVTNFQFSPEKANGPHVEGEGHAHVYADGVKLARIYGPWYHITLPDGTEEVSVTLNSNDHATLTVNGQPITASASIEGC